MECAGQGGGGGRGRRAAGACRLCLKPAAKTSLFTGPVTLQKKARSCLDIQIERDDGLPPAVCRKCEMKLNNYYDFRINCQLVDKKLRSHGNICLIQNSDSCHSIDVKQIETILKLDGDLDDWVLEDTKPILDNYNLCKNINKQELLKPPDTQEDTKLILDNHNMCNIIKQEPLNKSDTQEGSSFEKFKSKKDKQIPAQCEICGKIFKHKTALKKHIASHTGIKSYSCRICNKTFTRLEHEKVHMRAHKGIRPFICEVCARAFTKRQDLVRHMKIHSDEKRYPCTMCARRFKRSADVISHMKSHTGYRPYSCSSCEKSYTSHGGLKKHILAHCKQATVIRTS